MINEFEKFYAKIWKQGDSLVVTIPANLTKYTGWKEGDTIIIMAKTKDE